MLVASPRSQRYLQGEVVGFRRPLRLYGGPEHRRQIATQLDLKRLAGWVWNQHNSVYEAARGLGGLQPGVRLLECLRQFCDFGASKRARRRNPSMALKRAVEISPGRGLSGIPV